MRIIKFIGSIVFAFFLMVPNLKADFDDSPFSSISLTTAKEMAKAEGKYIFIDFYADWCVPCKWMDETTYTDSNVLNALKSDFVSVKINIDDFDGYTLKEEYNVTVLPTVIVLDVNGKVVRRFEESMSPTKLKDVLIEVSGNENINIKHNENISPVGTRINDNDNLKKNDNRTFEEDHAIVKTNTSYRVQVGVYTDYANTVNIVDNLNAKFDEPVVVLNSYLNKQTVYKIIVGDFEDSQSAALLKEEIFNKFGIKGFVTSFN